MTGRATAARPEKAVHRALRPYRMQGEWFEVSVKRVLEAVGHCLFGKV